MIKINFTIKEIKKLLAGETIIKVIAGTEIEFNAKDVQNLFYYRK